MIDIAIYNNQAYSFGADRDGKYDLCSLELDKNYHPINILKGIEKVNISGAYRATRWVKAKGCSAIFESKHDGKVILNVRPSEDVNVLKAKEVDRGVYEAQIEFSEIEKVWEERKPYLDFPFPEGYERLIELTVDDL